MSDLQETLAALPLIAILRGIDPEQAVEVGDVLIEAGFRAIEVPLNSPSPFESISQLVDSCGDRVLVGAGTVLRPAEVGQVMAAGGRLVVMPNADEAVIREAKQQGALCVPGVATPTEAFAALAAGADALKMFPAEGLPPKIVKAWRAVLPQDCWLLPVGGITPESLGPYLEAGADGFGLGSALFRPNLTVGEIAARADAFVQAFRRLDRG